MSSGSRTRLMLRGFVIGFGFLILLGSFIGLHAGLGLAMTGPVVLAALMVGGTIFERGRYRKAQAEIPGAGFERTAEAFNDPASGGEVVDVWYNKTTGERRYVQRR